MALDSTEMTEVVDDAKQWLGTSITVRQVTPDFSDSGLDSTTLKRTKANTDTVVTAVRSRVSSSMIAGAGGRVGIEDVAYQVKVADLTSRPKEGDKVIDGSDTRKIVVVDDAMHDSAYVLICRGERSS